MILHIAGLGPGNPQLITLEALNSARESDVLIVPRSSSGSQGIAEHIISSLLPQAALTPIVFPMTRNEAQRDSFILEQLVNIKPTLESSRSIFFPVIGDSMLYSTGAYLVRAMKALYPNLETRYIPGISAHSLAAACAKRFLAMGDEILSVVPGTADPERIRETVRLSDVTAIYKPTALKNMCELIDGDMRIVRVDFAGIPERERIIEGREALDGLDEYISIILIWRDKT